MQKSELLALGCIGFKVYLNLKRIPDKRKQLSFQEHAKEV